MFMLCQFIIGRCEENIKKSRRRIVPPTIMTAAAMMMMMTKSGADRGIVSFGCIQHSSGAANDEPKHFVCCPLCNYTTSFDI